jgi:hypothetical protein
MTNRDTKASDRPPGPCRLANAAALSIVLVTACARAARPLPADPAATFQAHVIHGGFMVDEMRGGAPTVASAPGWLRLPGDPALVLAGGGANGEAVWIDAPGSATVRAARASSAPLVGRVASGWEDDAVRLTIAPRGHRPLRSDPFVREDVGAGPSVLTRAAALSSDVDGSYRATIRYPDGTPAGWIRVRIGPHLRAPEIYDAVLPPSVDEALATAAAAALDADVDVIEAGAFGVHRGTRRP